MSWEGRRANSSAFSLGAAGRLQHHGVFSTWHEPTAAVDGSAATRTEIVIRSGPGLVRMSFARRSRALSRT